MACLLSLDLLPQVSWRIDEQKGQCRGNVQGSFPFPLFLFCLYHLFPYVFKSRKSVSEINVFNRHTAFGACGTFGEMMCIRFADMFLYFVWVHFIVWGGGQGLQPPSIYVLNFPPSLSSLHILLLRHHFTLKTECSFLMRF